MGSEQLTVSALPVSRTWRNDCSSKEIGARNDAPVDRRRANPFWYVSGPGVADPSNWSKSRFTAFFRSARDECCRSCAERRRGIASTISNSVSLSTRRGASMGRGSLNPYCTRWLRTSNQLVWCTILGCLFCQHYLIS